MEILSKLYLLRASGGTGFNGKKYFIFCALAKDWYEKKKEFWKMEAMKKNYWS